MNELKDTKDSWLVGILPPLDEIETPSGVTNSQMIALLLTMISDSVKCLQGRILSSEEELTDSKKDMISDGYINLLNESRNIILFKHSLDVSKNPYMLTELDNKRLKMYFFNILSDKFSNSLLIELFINNFMMCSIIPIINSITHRNLVTKEKSLS